MARVPHTRRSIFGLLAVVGLALGLLSVTINYSTAADARSSAAQLHNAPARQLSLSRSNTLSQILGKLAGTRAFRSLASAQPLPLPTPDPGTSPGPGPVDPTTTPDPIPTSDPSPTTDPTPTSGPSTSASPTSTPTPSSSPTPTVDPTPTSTPTPTPPADPNGTLVWSDDFNGSAGSAPDRSKWENQTGGSGWGNNELECYTNNRQNSALDGSGDLVITARYQPGYQCPGGTTNNYTSAKIDTYGLETMKYGKMLVRAKLPTASGLWPAIWALGDDNYSAGWPQSGEIDVAEVIGSSPSTVYGTIHGPANNGSAYGIGDGRTLSTPLSDAFHTYGVDWSPDSITFSLDGVNFKTITKSQVTGQGAWVFDHPYFMILNVAVGGNWPGSPNSNAVFPQQMTVDYVHVYQ